jgi:hypothetical protein
VLTGGALARDPQRHDGEATAAVSPAVFVNGRRHSGVGVSGNGWELPRDVDRLRHARLQYRGADWLVRTDAAPTITVLFRQAQVARPPLGRYRPAKALGALEIPKNAWADSSAVTLSPRMSP